MIPPENSIDAQGDPLVDLAVPPEEMGRIDQLLEQYDVLLAEADRLNAQIEGLLREWNHTAIDDANPARLQTPENKPQQRTRDS